MNDNKEPQSSIILYQTEDGRTRIQCRFENETVWLTQALMAELFQVTPQNVTLHLKALYEEGELDEVATCKEYLQVRTITSKILPADDVLHECCRRHDADVLPSSYVKKMLVAGNNKTHRSGLGRLQNHVVSGIGGDGIDSTRRRNDFKSVAEERNDIEDLVGMQSEL